MISYDKERNRTVDSETGDYLECLEGHYSLPYKIYAVFNKQRILRVVAELNNDESKVKTTPAVTIVDKKWTLLKAWLPHKPGEPRIFDVPQHLIDLLALFLKREGETRFQRVAPTTYEFEFIDARKMENSK